MRVLKVPLRINFIGGWSDQLCWRGKAAVVNASIGWEQTLPRGRFWPTDPYPAFVDAEGWHCRAKGVGTGLGISSIREAALWHYRVPVGGMFPAVVAALDAEHERGTLGGWQDPIGALFGGMKLITTPDHEDFSIERRDDHPILSRCVLFDTGIRRNSGMIGAKIRAMMPGGRYQRGKFIGGLEEIVRLAPKMFRAPDADHAIETCLAAWRLLCMYVPEMRATVPKIPGTMGSMLVGAGGGGYGLMFTCANTSQAEVVAELRAMGVWATVPVLLNGVEWEESVGEVSVSHKHRSV